MPNCIEVRYQFVPNDPGVWDRHAVMQFNRISLFWLLLHEYRMVDVQGWALVLAILIIPHWWTVPASALLPGVWLSKRIKLRKNFGPGFCRRCGYDLRASSE